jgi:hypothetical protein
MNTTSRGLRADVQIALLDQQNATASADISLRSLLV